MEYTTTGGRISSGTQYDVWIDESSEVLYNDHIIKIIEEDLSVKAEVTIKGKEYGLIFKKGQVEEAIKIAKQTIDFLSPKESQVITYKGSTIYVIRLKDKYIAKGLYDAYGAGKMLVEESGKTKKEVITKIKQSIKDLETLSNKIKERDEKTILEKKNGKKNEHK